MSSKQPQKKHVKCSLFLGNKFQGLITQINQFDNDSTKDEKCRENEYVNLL